MNIHVLINHPLVDLGSIRLWAENKGHSITKTAVYENQPFPRFDQFDLLIILGGTMSAYEEEKYPWLKKEKQFIKNAIQAEKAVLGICLGAQLIADCLGGRVYRQKHFELGWWDVQFSEKIKAIPVFKNLPTKLKAFQFHYDTFELPPEVKCLAKSDGCENQAFIYGDRVVGLQFHPEFTDEKILELVEKFGDEMKPGPYTQSPEEFIGEKEHVERAKAFLFLLLDNLEECIT